VAAMVVVICYCCSAMMMPHLGNATYDSQLGFESCQLQLDQETSKAHTARLFMASITVYHASLTIQTLLRWMSSVEGWRTRFK
jgi:hypothetical protein